MSYINKIYDIAIGDSEVLKKKDREYGGSWLKRGGVGAFMMLARKWDRIETAMQKSVNDKYDIITLGAIDGRDEGLLDDIGDLRRYLLLVEAEIRVRLEMDYPTEDHRLDPFEVPDGTCFDGPQSIH